MPKKTFKKTNLLQKNNMYKNSNLALDMDALLQVKKEKKGELNILSSIFNDKKEMAIRGEALY